MRRFALAFVALILVGGAGAAIARSAGSFSTVYTVADLRADLTRHPRAWLGRTVLVRGAVIGGWMPALWLRPAHSGPQPSIPPLQSGAALVDPAGHVSLPLASGGEDSLLSFLRRLPWVGRFAPRPQSFNWQAPAVYRVTIEAAPSGSCGHTTCYEARLLDSMPQPPLLLHAVIVRSFPATTILVATPAPISVRPQPQHASDITAPPAAP